ncbi:NAD-dependent epimerase/dehydratase-like protein [Viridothelium virens]|uniref:NAD-dependent epimerase/dehydratase-like protein n=1 Tax=Viridothelium virens TaxID=1048519 RepID=A0A6A6HP61_VIRVR|nr:NAD-dependent epimerase/dehydratase-like protein [Viridothelium virens]
MHFLVIGGSGRTGRLVINQILERRQSVIALVRDPTAFGERLGLTVVQGTPTSTSDLEKAFTAIPNGIPSAVIVTLNARRKSDNPFAKPISPPRFMADCNTRIRAAMHQHGVRKLVVMSAYGTADSLPAINWLMRLVLRKTNMVHQYNDHDAVDKETKTSGLDFVLVRPSMLAGGEAKPVKDWGDQGRGVPMLAKITRASVARFLVDAAQKSRWNGQTPVITN